MARKNKVNTDIQHLVDSKFKRTVQLKKRNYHKKLASELKHLNSTNPNDYWRFLKKITKGSKSCADVCIEDFTKHFIEKSRQPLRSEFSYEIMNKIERYVHSIDPKTDVSDDSIMNDLVNGPITESELIIAMKKTKNNKASGEDGIASEFYKFTDGILNQPLIALFNYIMESGQFPDEWSTGLINPIHKTNDKSNPENYRKITLLNSLSKIFESILNNRLVYYYECLNLNDPLQNGYKTESHTVDNAFILNGIAEKYRSQKRPVFVCFVDFKSAFDKVNRQGLLYKLKKSGIQGKMFDVLRNMFNKAKSKVKWNGQLGHSFINPSGVLQGGVISPNLFKIYLNDIRNYLGDDCGVQIGELILNYLLFADDLVLISETRSGLQKLLNRLDTFCKHWHLELNKDKTQFMVMNKKYDNFNNKSGVYYNGNLIKETDSYKYIGFIFGNNEHPLKHHCEHLSKKAYRAIFQLKTYLRKSLGSEMPYDLLLKLFDQQIRPILEYGSELWCPASKIEQLERVQLSYVKNIFGLNKHTPTLAVLGETGRFPLLLRQQDSQLNYWLRIQQLPPGHPVKETYKALLIISQDGHNTWSGRTMNLIRATVQKSATSPSNINNDTVIVNASREYRYKKFIDEYFEDLNSVTLYPKLRTYKLFKKHYCIEPYILTLKNKNYQRALFKLRASSHQLGVETGRHARDYVPLERRLCKYCSLSQVDDEYHFMINCSFHTSLREAMFRNINSFPGVECDYDPLSPNVFTDLLTATNELVLAEIGKYIYTAFTFRKLAM